MDAITAASTTYRVARPVKGELKAYRGRPTKSLEAARGTLRKAKVDAKGRYNPAKRRTDVIVEVRAGVLVPVAEAATGK